MKTEVYSCDRCGKVVPEVITFKKSISTPDNLFRISKHDFDLCKNCEKKLRYWLKSDKIKVQVTRTNEKGESK